MFLYIWFLISSFQSILLYFVITLHVKRGNTYNKIQYSCFKRYLVYNINK